MKKIIVVLSMLILVLCLVACGSGKCKASGCNDEATNGDYCEYHATLQQIDSAAKGAFDYLFGG